MQKAPQAKYTFDSERDAPQSELCRVLGGEKGRECIMVRVRLCTCTTLHSAKQLSQPFGDAKRPDPVLFSTAPSTSPLGHMLSSMDLQELEGEA